MSGQFAGIDRAAATDHARKRPVQPGKNSTASPPAIVTTALRVRQAALIAATRSLLGDRLVVDAKPAGLHAMAWLAAGLDAVAVSGRLAALGIEAPPLSNYAINRPARPGLGCHGAFTNWS